MAESKSGQGQNPGLTKKITIVNGMIELKLLRQIVDDYLNAVWRALRDDASPDVEAASVGALLAFHMVGLLNELECEAWQARMKKCPGHDDEGGRVWCAYCGNLNAEKAN